jgi:hypothetical protein
MAHPFNEPEEIREQDLGKYVSNFDKFQSSASVRRQHQSKKHKGRGQELSQESILNLDKNKLVFLIYWQNVKKVARKFRNAYFYELSQRSLTELQKEALAERNYFEEFPSTIDLMLQKHR